MHRYRPIPSALFAKKRAALTSQMKPRSIAIFHSNACMPRNGDQCFPFRQNSDFFMLCGIDRQPAALVLFPDAPKPEWKEVLFIPYTDEHMRIWEGASYTPEHATEISAIQHVEYYNQFKSLPSPPFPPHITNWPNTSANTIPPTSSSASIPSCAPCA